MTEENLRRIQVESPVHSIPVLDALRDCRLALKELEWRGQPYKESATCIWCGHAFPDLPDDHDCGLMKLLERLKQI